MEYVVLVSLNNTAEVPYAIVLRPANNTYYVVPMSALANDGRNLMCNKQFLGKANESYV